MAECFKCGVSDEKELLFDAISDEGVIKICKNCNEEEAFPLIRGDYVDRPQKTKTVYERLSQMAHLDPETHKRRIKDREELVNRQRQDKTLKDIVNENFNKQTAIKTKREDLVDNFHWVIMRVRRARKLTQKQLAENIGEPESVIKAAEEGYVATNSDTLIKKLETYFGIKLFREVSPSSLYPSAFAKQGMKEVPTQEDLEKQKIKENFEKEPIFDSETARTLTISDLQDIKKKKESEGGIFSFFRRNKKEKEEKEKSENEKELSDDEANEILFGEE